MYVYCVQWRASPASPICDIIATSRVEGYDIHAAHFVFITCTRLMSVLRKIGISNAELFNIVGQYSPQAQFERDYYCYNKNNSCV